MIGANGQRICVDPASNWRATTDRDLIAHCVSEALGFLQVDEESEVDAFQMLGGAIEDAARENPARCAALLEVWHDLEEQRRAP
jgi:hypothetical protein